MTEDEVLRPIDEATTHNYGSHVSPFSVRRWISKGIGNPPVKLRAVRLGGRYFLRQSDIDEFNAAVRDPSAFAKQQKSQRVETAKRKLQRAGA